MIEKTAKDITTHLLSKLPSDRRSYQIAELTDAGFPAFLERYIQEKIQLKVNSNLSIPDSEWVDVQDDTVQQAWERLLKEFHREIVLPADEARSLVEPAVKNIIRLLVQPRAYIPDFIMGDQEKISAAALPDRTRLLVVYPHFASVLRGYVERKALTELSREQCKKIVWQVDEKVTGRYDAPEWVQMLEPLFAICGGAVDARLLRQFYQDREMTDTAQIFADEEEEINRDVFINLLVEFSSIPPKEKVIKSEKIQAGTEDEQRVHETAEKATNRNQFHQSDQPAKDHIGTVTEETEAVRKSFGKNRKSTPPNKLDKNENISSSDESSNAKQERASLNDVFSGAEGEENQSSETIKTERGASSFYEESQQQESESPIWMRFMDSDEADSDETNTDAADSDEMNLNETERQESMVEASRHGAYAPEMSEEEREIAQLFVDSKDYFTKRLFDGSKRQYRKAIQAIADKDSWKDASKYVNEHIFEQNGVNIYSKAAVDFTDRLQNHFADGNSNY